MSDVTFLEPSHYAVTKLFRRISVVGAVGLSLLLAAHDLTGALEKCFHMLSPGPFVCPVTAVTLPDNHDDTNGPNSPGQWPSIPPTKTTSANSVTPCPDPSPEHSPR